MHKQAQYAAADAWGEVLKRLAAGGLLGAGVAGGLEVLRRATRAGTSPTRRFDPLPDHVRDKKDEEDEEGRKEANESKPFLDSHGWYRPAMFGASIAGPIAGFLGARKLLGRHARRQTEKDLEEVERSYQDAVNRVLRDMGLQVKPASDSEPTHAQQAFDQALDELAESVMQQEQQQQTKSARGFLSELPYWALGLGGGLGLMGAGLGWHAAAKSNPHRKRLRRIQDLDLQQAIGRPLPGIMLRKLEEEEEEEEDEKRRKRR